MEQITRVSTVEGLIAALDQASDNDIITLAAGTYDALITSRQNGFSFDKPVTIRSEDPDNPAVFSHMNMAGVSGITFENVTFDYTYETGDHWLQTEPFQVRNSENVTFKNCHFSGDNSATDADPATVNGTPGFANAHGLVAMSVDGLAILDCEFEGFARGAKLSRIVDGTVAGNDFHSQRMDHLVMSEVQGMVIENNYMHDFQASEASNDHRDMIQLWTINTKIQSRDVIIKDNIMVLGEEDDFTQTIFLGNNAVALEGAGPEMFLENFAIVGNVVVNAHAHGIMAGPAHNFYVANNTFIREDGAHIEGTIEVPRIQVHSSSTGVVIVDNMVSEITPQFKGKTDLPDMSHTWIIAGNVAIQDTDPNAPGWYGDVFINPSVGGLSDLSNIQFRPDSPLDLDGKGAPMLVYNETPQELTALIAPQADSEDWTAFHFDAGFTADADGRLGARGSYHWDFGDGNGATGLTASHAYTRPGTYIITLTVTGADGSVDQSTARVTVADDHLFSLGAQAAVAPHLAVQMQADTDGDLGQIIQAPLSFSEADQRFEIDNGTIAPLFDAEDFDFTVTLRSDDWSQGAGEVARVHSVFNLSVDTDGTVRFRLMTDDGVQHVITAPEALQDGVLATVGVRLDAETDLLQVTVDGTVMAEMAVTGDLPANNGRGLTFGQPFGQIAGFVGDIQSAQLRANMAKYVGLVEDEVPAAGADPEADPDADDLPLFNLFEELDSDDCLFMDDACLSEDGLSVVLDGDSDCLVINGGDATELAPQTTLAFTYARDIADGAAVRLVWNHRNLAVDAVEDGIGVRVRLADGQFRHWRIEDLGLNDTDRHAVKLHVDEVTDQIRLHVDGQEVFFTDAFDVDLTGNTHGSGSKWYLGGAWTGYLDGTVGDVQLGLHGEVDPDMPVSPIPMTVRQALDMLPLPYDTFDDPELRSFGQPEDSHVIEDVPVTGDSHQLTLALDVQRAEDSEAYAKLVNKHGFFTLGLVDDGLHVRVANEDGTMDTIRVDDLGLSDDDWHRITVLADDRPEEDADLLAIYVDGAKVAQSDGHRFDFTAADGAHDWVLGGQWTGHFNGNIDDLIIADSLLIADAFALA